MNQDWQIRKRKTREEKIKRKTEPGEEQWKMRVPLKEVRMKRILKAITIIKANGPARAQDAL